METKENALNREIMSLTTFLKAHHPEVYRNMNEMPITIPNMETPEVKIRQLEDYLQSLKVLIKTHSA